MNNLDIDLDPHQAAARDLALDWACSGLVQPFGLFGGAGTGKTTLGRVIGDILSAEYVVQYAAPTGKAAFRLRQAGAGSASTLHRLIYRPTGKDKHGNLQFALHEDPKVGKGILVVLDEASMVNTRQAEDLLNTGARVLAIADPFQLPPVTGQPYFEESVCLTHIHRQVAGNPIIAAATHVRTRAPGSIPVGVNEQGRCQSISSDLVERAAAYVDQILCGTNRTRQQLNGMCRKLQGILSIIPEPGEKLVCVKNNPAMRLFNGGLWRVEDSKHIAPYVELTLSSLDDPDEPHLKCRAPLSVLYEEENPNDFQDPNFGLFQWGYAITVHKSQGSQWDRVLLVEESHVFREHKLQWLYTGITRAAKELYVTNPL